MELIERFFAKVDATGDCWEWTASRSPDGYGRLKVEGVAVGAHRIAYRLLVGTVPDGLTLDHLCRNRGCVNPDHLEAVPRRVNNLRGFGRPAMMARQSTCPKGHPYDSLHRNGVGNRLARTCSRCTAEKQRRYRARLRAAA